MPSAPRGDLLLLRLKREFAKFLRQFVTCLDLRLRELSRFFRKVRNQSLKFGYRFLCSICLSFEQAF